jgi:hypothetical protein
VSLCRVHHSKRLVAVIVEVGRPAVKKREEEEKKDWNEKLRLCTRWVGCRRLPGWVQHSLRVPSCTAVEVLWQSLCNPPNDMVRLPLLLSNLHHHVSVLKFCSIIS